MPETSYLGIPLPTYDDDVDVEVLNAGTEAIDAELERVNDDVVSVGAANATFAHAQSIAAVMWSITHNLGARPVAITVIDGNGDELDFYAVHHTSANALELTFGSALAGTALLKA